MDRPGWTERVGLCSVTLRHHPVGEVVAAASAAGLRRIEWGADVHAPPGSPGLADVREATVEAGLTVSSYGTYWRAGRHRAAEATPLLEAATALEAGRIRVWAGDRGTGVPPTDTGTVTADADWWSLVTADLRELCRLADDTGIEVALEFHPDTLTDTVTTTRQLLERVGHPVLSTYWQPRVGEESEPAVTGLVELLDVVSAVHVFSWWPGTERLPLTERADLWTGVLDVLTARREPLDLLLEFVPDDDVAVLGREAATLRGWLGG